MIGRVVKHWHRESEAGSPLSLHVVAKRVVVPISGVNRSEAGELAIRLRFVQNSFQVLICRPPPSHCGTESPWARRPRSTVRIEWRPMLPAAHRFFCRRNLMPVSFSPPHNRDARARGVGVTAVLGPTNTGKTHLAIERMLAHSSGMIGLPLRLLAREVYQKVVDKVGATPSRSSPARRRSSRPILASGSPPWRRCRATSTSRFWRSTRSRSAPTWNVVTSSPTGCSTAAAAKRPWCSAPPRSGPWSSGSSRAPYAEPAAPVATAFAGEKKLTRLQRRSAVVAFSAEEVYAVAELIRRQRGGAAVVLGALVAAHPQCPGRALSVGRRRLSGGDRRHRHGAQPRRRARRLRGRPEVRRLPVPRAQSGRARPDRRARRACDARRNFRHDRALPAVRDRTGAGPGESQLRVAQGSAVAQHRARFFLARRAAGVARRDPARAGTDAGAGRRRHPRARARRARRRRAQAGARAPKRSSGCGKYAKFRTTGRSLPPITRNSPPPSMVS